MADYKIAFFGVRSWERELIEKEMVRLDSFGVGVFESEVESNLELAARYEVLSVSIHSKIDKNILDKLPELKMIATRSTGTDHVNLEECERRKVKVMNVPEYGSETVAEHAMALLLAITKKIVVSHQAVEDGEFSPQGLTGVDLAGKTLGVIGVGKIGQNMVRMARGFRMKVLGVERKKDEELEKKLGFKTVDLEMCLKESDFISLHVPSLPETFHLINMKNIKLMKQGSYLVNISRGPVIETEALVWALNHKILAGVGLDVTEEEDKVESISVVMNNKTKKDDLKEIISYHLLRDRDDVVFTPHNAFNTKEAIERIVKTTVENINKFIKL